MEVFTDVSQWRLARELATGSEERRKTVALYDKHRRFEIGLHLMALQVSLVTVVLKLRQIAITFMSLTFALGQAAL